MTCTLSMLCPCNVRNEEITLMFGCLHIVACPENLFTHLKTVAKATSLMLLKFIASTAMST